MTLSVYHLLVLIGTVLFCLGLKYILAKPFYQLSERSVKQLNIIMDAETDEDEKDTLILKNLLGLLKMFFLVLFVLVLLIFLASLPVLIYQKLNPNSVADTSSIYFYGSMFLGSFSILFFKDKSDYTYWSKLLHSIILDNYNVGKYLFKKDKAKLKNPAFNENFVIVSGLARAGTTALARMIYDPAIFHSTKYSNMPFIMAPKFWKRFYNPKKSKAKQRAHGDNVMHSETSIEAMEEYFFKAQLNDSYINESALQLHEVDGKIYQEYLHFQSLYIENSDTRFLAKNNNLILRLKSLRQHNKNFKVLLMFRHPMDHAKSLLNQHRNFIKQQKADPFTLKYMDWLGHHEFGLNQKCFDLGDEVDFASYDKSSLTYWLLTWYNYYQYLIKLLPDQNIILLDYQDLLENPNALKKQLGKSLGVSLNENEEKPFSAISYADKMKALDDQFDENINKKILKLYEDLKSQKLSIV